MPRSPPSMRIPFSQFSSIAADQALGKISIMGTRRNAALRLAKKTRYRQEYVPFVAYLSIQPPSINYLKRRDK